MIGDGWMEEKEMSIYKYEMGEREQRPSARITSLHPIYRGRTYRIAITGLSFVELLIFLFVCAVQYCAPLRYSHNERW